MTRAAVSTPSSSGRSRPRGQPIPAEGDNGVFSESWFAICPSYEVGPGQIVGKDFLDGRVVVFRDGAGRARVLSAYCPHVGADLSVGEVIDGRVRCAFHHWEFDGSGACVKTGIGDPSPKNACLYEFHSEEKFGLVWAFNGERPWWRIPDFPIPEQELAIDVRYEVPPIPVDPWVVCANTPDWQHIKVVHRVDFDFVDLYDRIEWTDHSMRYSFSGRMFDGTGPEVAYNVGIFGTSIFHLHGTMDGQWYAVMTAFGIPRPGVTQSFFVLCVRKGDGSPESEAAIARQHDFIFRLGKRTTSEDRPILHTIRYTPGALTRADRALARYLEMVRRFPRSHPSADFIR